MEDAGEEVPVRVRRLRDEKPVQRGAGDITEPVRVEVLERHGDDPATGDKSGRTKPEQARQQFAARRVAGGADENDAIDYFGDRWSYVPR